MPSFSNIVFPFFIACAFQGIGLRCNGYAMQPSESDEDDWLSLPRTIAVDEPEEDLISSLVAENASVPEDDWFSCRGQEAFAQPPAPIATPTLILADENPHQSDVGVESHEENAAAVPRPKGRPRKKSKIRAEETTCC